MERDQLIITLRARNEDVHRSKEESLKELEGLRAEHKLAVENLKDDYEAQIRILKEENAGIISAHTHEMDKVLKVETSIDEYQNRIKELEKELGRKNDEIELRKEVIDSMSASMMKHEKENRELVSKLVLLKN